MKKTTLFTIFILVLGFAGQAQISQGTFFVGGSLGFATNTSKVKVGPNESTTSEMSSFTFAPSVGYFVADRTAVGLRAGISSTKNVNYQGNGDKTTTTRTPIDVGIFAQRYFMIIPEFGFTGGVFVSTRFGNEKVEDFDQSTNTTTVTESSISGFTAGLTGGTIWFPTPNLGFHTQVGILSFTTETETVKDSNPEISSTDSGFNFDLSSMSLLFGFHYYFN